MAATSTGGLISIMLGRLSMTVEECLEAYEILSDRVFGNQRWLHFLMGRSKYDHKVLEGVIKEIIKQRDPRGKRGTQIQHPNEDMCQIMVLAWKAIDVVERRPYIFRSYILPKMAIYPTQRNPGEGHEYDLWRVARATSAAPFYFPPMDLKESDPKFRFLDGGLGANDPSKEAWESIKQLNGNDAKAVDINVSIGAGRVLESNIREPLKRGLKRTLSIVLNLINLATDTHATHENMQQLSHDHGFDDHRLNVKDGVGKMKLDAWKGKGGKRTLEKLSIRTQVYLESEEARRGLKEAAEILVTKRRLRSSYHDQDRWERFCHSAGHDGNHTVQ